MKNNPLYPILISELKQVYWLENRLFKLLAQLENESVSENSARTFKKYRAQVQEHVNRLRSVFILIGEEEQEEESFALAGLIQDGKQSRPGTDISASALDICLISSALKIGYYKTAAYKNLSVLCRAMGLDQAEGAVSATLEEEQQTIHELGSLTESYL
jgi:ferritin-like metal-binding protein YciE